MTTGPARSEPLASAAFIRCRLCAGLDVAPLYAAGAFRLARCRRCDLVQVIDRVSTAEMHRIYGHAYFNHEKYRDDGPLRRENRRRLKLVQGFVGRCGARVLEAGCGTGDFMAAAKHRYRISGFDLSPHAVAIARRSNPDIADRIWCGGLEETVLARGRFDAVCLWDVIEHLWDFEPLCRRLLEAIRPGGYLFLSTPDIRSGLGRILGRYWPLMTPPEHVSFFSSRSLRHLFEGRLNARVVYSAARGKWINWRFALRKIQRVVSREAPARLLTLGQNLLPPGFSVYMPSRDIRYAAVRKRSGARG
jgi:2-polyprenyl-3-methyl-5-hydroxy-6-metoxy-1,4-benzoquinol methylase